MEEDYHRFLHQQPRGLSDDERDAIRQLAVDIPALWQASTTTPADHKDLVRQVGERVEVAVQGASEQVQVRVWWIGGGQTEGVLTRPIARFADRSDYPELCDRVRMLVSAGWSAPAIARQLDADGYPPGQARGARQAQHVGRSWSVASVLTLRRQVGLGGHHQRGQSREALGPNEWWASALANALSMPRSCLHAWIQRGQVRAHQEARGLHRWIVWADATELERLRAYRARDVADEARRQWTAVASPLRTPERN